MADLRLLTAQPESKDAITAGQHSNRTLHAGTVLTHICWASKGSSQTLETRFVCCVQVQAELGASRSLAFDLTAACSGFVIGLVTAAQFIRTGTYRNVLVIGADALSRYIDWRDRGWLHKEVPAYVHARMHTYLHIHICHAHTHTRPHACIVSLWYSCMPLGFLWQRKSSFTF